MYETIEYFDNNGFELKDVLKQCIYKYYLKNKGNINLEKSFKKEENNSIIKTTNKVDVVGKEVK